jgi:FkbM family methyltransferase
MNVFERIHMLHRAWRYRLRTERDEIDFLLSCDLNGQTAVDVGANRGVYSWWMHKKVGPHGHVIAFEPQPELVSHLHQLKNDFRLSRLTIVGAGLSSRPGVRVLCRPKEHWGGGSLEYAPHAGTDAIDVPVATLDDYFRSSSVRPVRFIKCDVEGHEPDVFLGGRTVLREDRPDLLFESHETRVEHSRLVAYLTELEYEGFFFFQHELTPLARLAELRGSIARPYLNLVFRTKSGM